MQRDTGPNDGSPSHVARVRRRRQPSEVCFLSCYRSVF
jgi:hypothetical protein